MAPTEAGARFEVEKELGPAAAHRQSRCAANHATARRAARATRPTVSAVASATAT